MASALATKVDTALLGANNGVATLGADGKLNASQVNAIAISDTFVVATQAAMLALTAEVGDIAVRTDQNKTYILRASPASTLANWQELLTPSSPVSSVFGRTGAVTAASGDYTVAQVTGAAPLASPALTGTPTAPTAPTATNTTQIATTAFVATQPLAWYGVLAIAVAIALWLVLTRGGRLALAAARIGISSLPQRWGASSVIVVGIAGVVGVLVAMLAMGEGFKATLESTGDDTSAIVLRGGSQAETNSVITRDQVPLIGTLAGIARDADGRPLLSPELSQVVNLPSKADGSDVNAQFRGVGERAWAVRDKVRVIEGRAFSPGLREIVVGQGARGQFRVVGHHHDGGALLVDVLQQLHHAARHLRVEVAGRFVGQQQARAAGQRAGDRHALLLTAGQRRGQGVRLVGEAYALQQLHRLLVRLGLGNAAHLARAEGHVVDRLEVREEVEALEHHADVGAQAGELPALLGQPLPVDGDLPGGDRLEPVQAAAQGRLPGAGGADQRHDLAAVDVEIDALQRLEVAEELVDAAHGDQGLAGAGSPRGAGRVLPRDVGVGRRGALVHAPRMLPPATSVHMRGALTGCRDAFVTVPGPSAGPLPRLLRPLRARLPAPRPRFRARPAPSDATECCMWTVTGPW